uniref:HEAT repeat-containing taxis proteinF n=1 Tax=Candidatus Methanophaga sp. ANME-1 ERB7 TaxID=2759913 RepID=A0A7G9Z2I4_9EURY|nr:hypothetical protein FMKGKFDM_00001 [Methanosarcinales archaeon ANME-1 ERB7]
MEVYLTTASSGELTPLGIRELREVNVAGNKILAMKALGKYSGDEVVTALERELGGWNWLVKRAAVEALGRCGNSRVVGILREQLQNPNEEIKAEAIIALGKRLGKEFAQELVTMPIGADEYNVREAASLILAKYVETEGASRKIAEILVETGDFRIRKVVFAALGKCNDNVSRDKLIEELSGYNSILNYHIAGEALGKRAERGDETAFQALVSVIENGDRHAVRGAIRGLGASGRPEALEPLSRAFEKVSMTHEVQAIRKAIKACGGTVTEHLRPHCESNGGFEYTVWDASGEEMTPSRPERHDTSEGKVSPAPVAKPPEIVPGAPEVVPEPPKKPEPVKEAVAESESADCGGSVINRLATMIYDPNPDTARDAAVKLGEKKDEENATEVTYLLIGILGNESENVKLAAIASLGNVGTIEAIVPLVQMLADDSVNPQLVDNAIGKIITNTDSTETSVRKALEDGSEELERNSSRLSKPAEKVLEKVIRRVKSNDTLAVATAPSAGNAVDGKVLAAEIKRIARMNGKGSSRKKKGKRRKARA